MARKGLNFERRYSLGRWERALKLVVLSDLHIISPQDKFKQAHRQRVHFAQTWDSLKSIQKLVRQEAPDLIISVGDLVDWYSAENRDQALEFLDYLNASWYLTPGNHDLASYRQTGEEVSGPFSTPELQKEARRGWGEAGVCLDNRIIETDSTQLLLLDSATVEIPNATQKWLEESIKMGTEKKQRLLFSHVPFNVRPVREFITSFNPEDDPAEKLQRGMGESLETLLLKLDAIYTGHLHSFPGRVSANGTAFYLLPLSVVAKNSSYPRQGTITSLLLDGSAPRQILVE